MDMNNNISVQLFCLGQKLLQSLELHQSFTYMVFELLQEKMPFTNQEEFNEWFDMIAKLQCKNHFKEEKQNMDTMEQNIEREMVGSAALEIQTIIMKSQNELSIFLFELIEEMYELNPCSELLRKWQVRLLDSQASRGSQ